MYCKNCGKFIGNDNELCDECLAQQNQKSEIVDDQNLGDVCLGKAIAATVISFMAFMMSFVQFVAAIATLEELSDENVFVSSLLYEVGVYPILGVLFGLPAILSLVFGILSIANFKRTSRQYGKRIPTLIMGIQSVVMSAIAMLFVLINLVLAIVIFNGSL